MIFLLMFQSYAADKKYKCIKKNFRSLKMPLNISQISLNDTLLGQKRASATVDTSAFSELNLRTGQGDLVSLSFSEQRSLSEPFSQAQTRESDTSQEFSSIAKANSSYSLTVEGNLNVEELEAIKKLAEEITPLAEEFFSSGKLNLDNPSDILDDSFGPLVQLELSLGRTVKTTLETKSVKQFPEQTDEVTIKELPNQISKLETDGIRDYPALVTATIDAVFKYEAERLPSKDFTPRPLNNLVAYIRDRIGGFLNSTADLDALSIESISNTDGVVGVETALKAKPFTLKT